VTFTVRSVVASGHFASCDFWEVTESPCGAPRLTFYDDEHEEIAHVSLTSPTSADPPTTVSIDFMDLYHLLKQQQERHQNIGRELMRIELRQALGVSE
jgi:hypothetical protein